MTLRALVPAAVLLAAAASPALAAGDAWLGVSMKTTPQGAVEVTEVFPGSPADPGLRKGDVLLRADGEALTKADDLSARISQLDPGAPLTLALRRGEEQRELRVVLGEHPGLEALVRNQHLDKPAPELKGLVGVGGAPAPRLADLRGKVVLLEFYAGWCTACHAMSPVIQGWHQKYKGRGLAVVGVTNDDPAVAARVVEEWHIPYPVGCAADDLPYAAVALPTTFLIDRKGVVRDVMIGGSSGKWTSMEKKMAKLLADKG